MGRIFTPVGYGDTITSDCNTINFAESTDQKKAKLEAWIAKQIGTKLMRHYPKRQWKVIVDIPGQMLIVACDSISNNKGYHLKMKGHTIFGLGERAVKAAGEILERHQIARSKRFDPDIIETLVRDHKDDVIAPDSAPEPI